MTSLFGSLPTIEKRLDHLTKRRDAAQQTLDVVLGVPEAVTP